MLIKLAAAKDTQNHSSRIVLGDTKTKWDKYLSPAIAKAARAYFDKKETLYIHTEGSQKLYLVNLDTTKAFAQRAEQARRAAYTVLKSLNAAYIAEAVVSHDSELADIVAPFVEGMVLSSYDFLKYKTKDVKPNTLTKLLIHEKSLGKKEIKQIEITTAATCLARTLVNEPLSFLTVEQLCKEAQMAGKAAGFKVTILDKRKIEALKMGGLLAVNRGSMRPPAFIIMEYKPAKAKNKKPIILVGKGVVYDTGGLSLKPTANSMDMMKCDMGGAATVIGAIYAAARMELPLHIVALVPATDNRPGMDAYVPGDVVPMMNGMNVEVLNTDAEGRMILGDALAYADKYKPELVMDFATLTGAAKAAISGLGTVYMGTADDKVKKAIEQSGWNTYERLVEFPLWEEYAKLIKSDIADIKNVGGPDAGAITAGKFLECFTSYPWLHFDIAGAAYLLAEDSYRGKYGTGVGVRLLVDFLMNYGDKK